MPVIRFVAPGPLVAIATPTLPVTRANPSAANTAPCSCRVRMCRTPLPSSASYSGMIAPPGYPNTRSTPSARRHCKTMSAPLSIHHLFGVARSGSSLLAFFGQPAHHAAQLRAHDFDGMLLLAFAQLIEIRAPCLVFGNPFLGKFSGLDVGQRLLHGLSSG